MQLKSGRDLLGLWQRYRFLHSQCVAAVHKQEECADRLLKTATDREITEEESRAWIRDCNVSRDKRGDTQGKLKKKVPLPQVRWP